VALTGQTRSAARRIRRLAYVGAGRAASAFAAFLRRDLKAREPRLCATSGATAARWGESGVIFEVEGAVQGLMALMLPSDAREWLREALCPEATLDSDVLRSAFSETANIVASHAVSAMADHLGARITLSIPLLVDEGADRVFGRMLDERRTRREGVATQTDLCAAGGARRALLLFAPDTP